MIDLRNILTITRKEIRDALRNRWFLLYTFSFAGLALAFAVLSQPDTTLLRLSGFGRTAASLINLALFFIPLIGLTLGALSIANERERGVLDYLMTQPISTTEILLGKYLGLSGALLSSLCLGFGLSAGVLSLRGSGGAVAGYVLMVGLACLLGLAMLSLGFLLSVMTHKTSVALGSAIFLWLFLVFVGDLGLMGTAVVTKLPIEQVFFVAAINPLEMFKISAILSIQAHLEVLGPAGIYATHQFGDSLLPILTGGLFLWILVPLLGALKLFTGKTISKSKSGRKTL